MGSVSKTCPRGSRLKPAEIERQYEAGEIIVERGSTERVLYVIRSGEVRLEAGDQERTLLLGQGELFGEIGAILGEPMSIRAVADSDVTVLAIELDLLNRLCGENADFSFRLIRHLAQRVATPEVSLESAGSIETSKELRRLAAAILSRTTQGDPPIPIEGMLADLARDAGLPVREAYLLVQDLLEKRVLRLADDRLSLLEPGRLAGLS
jgi:CRP-like cAMP-binding protein